MKLFQTQNISDHQMNTNNLGKKWSTVIICQILKRFYWGYLFLRWARPASSLFSFKRNILERLKNTSSVKTYLVENVAAFANLQRTSQHQGTAFTLPFTFLNLSFRTQHKTLWKCFLQRKMNPKHARKPKQKKNQWMTNHTSYLSKTPQTCLCKKILPGVNFYRFNAKNWRFLQI